MVSCELDVVALIDPGNDELETPGYSGMLPAEILTELHLIPRHVGAFSAPTEKEASIVKAVGRAGRSWLVARFGQRWDDSFLCVAGPFSASSVSAPFPAASEDHLFFVGQLMVVALSGLSSRFPLVPVTAFLDFSEEVADGAISHLQTQDDDQLSSEASSQIRACVRAGDCEGLHRALQSAATYLPKGKVSNGDMYRFYRNKYLTSCGTCSEIAFEVGLDSRKVQELTAKYMSFADKAVDLATLGHLAFRLFDEFTREISYFLAAKNSAKVRKMLAFIQGYMEKPLSLADVAGAVDLSPSYATALLKKETGRSFSETLREIRMKEAMKLLRNTSLSVGEIAASVGFALPNHFSKVFRETTGCNPSEYRKDISKI